MIALEGDHSDLDLGPLVHREDEFDGVGRGNFLVGGLDHGELMAVQGLQFLDYGFRLLDLGGVELALDREAHFVILESIENIGFADGLIAVVLDPADDGPLDQVKNDDFGVGITGTVLDFEANILEILSIPKGLEIPPQSLFVVGIAFSGKDPRLQGLAADAAIPLEFNAVDNRPGLLRSRRSGGRNLRFRIGRSHRATRSDLRPQGHSKGQQADCQ